MDARWGLDVISVHAAADLHTVFVFIQ